MTTFILATGILFCIMMLLTLYRVIVGPTVIDRLMGANVIGTKTTVLLVIIGAIYHRIDMFVDIALAYALLNFIVTVAASRYFQHRSHRLGGKFGFSHAGEADE